ncbi:hypothetical protein ILUMI_19984 [Ignelater luminosus]|uniref:Sulfotransferase domain-containing protein n=1 Tax=Ignelater luminosus TaxID=2038154 RepID=A0A8K0CH64_IGNLU|nr:hypothetical protein ILUMI_19984 [Ignelater luminosus]
MDYLNAEEVTDNDEIGRIIHKQILNEFCTGYILVGEERTCIPKYYLRFADEIKNFEVKDDDIWVTSYMKTGTTWTQEMVWLIANNLDFKGAEENLNNRFPFLEFSTICDLSRQYEIMKVPQSERTLNTIEKAAKVKSPRFIKTHLPYSLLPDQIKNGIKTPKIVYVWRNPKDTCVSFYHHGILLEKWKIDLETFAKLFMADKVLYGSYWKHIFGYWNLRDSPNVLIIRYEDMKANLPSVIKKVAKFLGKELTEEQIELLTKHLNFQSMRENKAVNKEGYVNQLKENNLSIKDGRFMRSGTVGKYKEELSAETIKKLDEWIKQNVSGTDFEKEYDFSL